MSNLIERRFFSSAELRASMKGGKRTIAGYAAKYSKPTDDTVSKMLGFVERCGAGCFNRAINSRQDVRCLMNHDPNLVLGRTTNNTLKLRSDSTGLWYECELPDTQTARDLHTLITRGDVSQCSFSFIPKADKWDKEKNAAGDWQASRTLVDVDLLDVSPVTYPCYTDTEVNAASRGEKVCDCDDDDCHCEENSLQEVEHNAIRRMWPNGIPAEVRSHISRPRRFDPEIEKMRMRVELALRD